MEKAEVAAPLCFMLGSKGKGGWSGQGGGHGLRVSGSVPFPLFGHHPHFTYEEPET